MLVAIAFYIAASIGLIYVEQRLALLGNDDAVIDWLNDHVYTPALRTFALVAFILLAYPDLYGLTDAPSLATVLRDGRADLLLTTLFFISLFLPLVTVVDRIPGAILALQGILGCAMLASWVGDALDRGDINIWVGWPIIAQIIAILLAGLALGRLASWLYAPRLRQRYAGPVREAARLAAEIPAILVYSFAVGQQFLT
ncbi:MAG: hypothetical protein KJO55_08035 [Gammaproteobacteria bacterium]|nr:hypothetical protein [Gammaproteobacteria bacterium]